MNYNIEESFTLVKHDPNWIKKMLIASGIAIVSLLLFFVPPIIALVGKTFNIAIAIEIGICWIIAGFLSMALSGYCLKAANERIFYRDTLLPDWRDFWSFLFLGFKSLLGSLMFYLPILAIGLAVGICDGFSKSTGSTSGTSFLLNSIYNILYFVFLFFYFAFNANFLKDFNVFSYLNYAAAYRRIKGNFVQYAILVALIMALGFVFNFVAFFLCITVVGILLLPFATIYMQLVSLDFAAQFIRITENKQ